MKLKITVTTDDDKVLVDNFLDLPMKIDEATIWASHSLHEAVKFVYKIDTMIDDDDEDGPRIPLVPLLRDVVLNMVKLEDIDDTRNALMNTLDIIPEVADKIIIEVRQGVEVKIAEKVKPEEAMRIIEALEAVNATVKMV